MHHKFTLIFNVDKNLQMNKTDCAFIYIRTFYLAYGKCLLYFPGLSISRFYILRIVRTRNKRETQSTGARDTTFCFVAASASKILHISFLSEHSSSSVK